MKTEKEIRERLTEIEDLYLKDPDTGKWEEDAYLDEGQQAEVMALLWVLGED
jgi:hypothetical protein